MMTTAKNHCRVLPAALLLACGIAITPLHAAPDGKASQKSHEQIVQSTLAALDLGEPIQAGPLTLIPIHAKTAPAALKITSSVTDAKLDVLLGSRRRPMIRVHNGLSHPLFLAAGRVAGTEDGENVVFGHDVIVPPKSSSAVDGLAGSFTKGKAVKGDVLTLSPRYAPPALREAVISDGTSYDVKTFLALFSEVAGDDMDRIPTLRQVMDSPFARNLDAEVAQVLHSEKFLKDRTVGFAAGIFGRLTTLQIFATPDLMRQNLAEILGSHGVYASAMMVRGVELGIPVKREDAAMHAVRDDAVKLLSDLRTKSSVPATGTPNIRLIAPGAIGHGVWHHGQVAHLVVYPHDPYERALFSRMFDLDAVEDDLDEESEATGYAQGQLERADDRRTTTEFEKRLLERRRKARGDG